MQQPTLRLGQAISTAWQAIKRYPGLAIGCFLLYWVITGAACAAPIVSIVAYIVVLPPMMGGLCILFLNMVDGTNPEIGDLFAGFRTLGKWMGIYWLFCAVVVGTMVPVFALSLPLVFAPGGPESLIPHEAVPAVAGGVSAVALAYVVGLVWLLIRWTFVYLAGVESSGVLEAFGRSSEITRGRRLHLFGLMFVLALLSICGVFALVLGLIVTIPLAMLAQIALYRQLNPRPAPQASAPGTQASAGEGP
jgi:uncharacterized membrane protein